MNPKHLRIGPLRGAAALLLVAVGAVANASQLELSGFAGLEVRLFPHSPASMAARRNDASLVLQPELFLDSADGRHSVLFVPFLRLDSSDERRRHFDIRELVYHRFEPRWELKAGLSKVFWGVVESRHLVDIINQTDLVENPDGEDKLGQPMLDLTLKQDWGTLDIFVLPGFRERSFPGRRGRLRSEPYVDTHEALYESPAGARHVDLALRFSHALGDWDLGLAHFYGTSREPRFLLRTNGGGEPRLVPRYDLIHRSSLDLQATKGPMLWKLEAVLEAGQGASHLAWVAGGEYTVFGIGGGTADLGLLLEHLLDGRGRHAPQPFENDLFIGARLAFNDAASTELLAGVIQDLGGDGRMLSVEASHRISDHWSVDLEARVWAGVRRGRPESSMARDDYLQFTLKRFF